MEQNITMLNPKWRKDMFFCSMICPCCFALIYKEGSDGSDDNGT